MTDAGRGEAEARDRAEDRAHDFGRSLDASGDEIARLRFIEHVARVVERKIGRETRALKDLAEHIEAGEGDASEIRCHEAGLRHAHTILRRALDGSDD